MNKSQVLLVIGLALIVIVQIYAQYAVISDLDRGLMMGVGFGLSLYSLMIYRRRRVRQ